MIISGPELYARGFTHLLPIIPPKANLAPSSNVPSSALGKVPGRKAPNGLWAGFAWASYVPTEQEVGRWAADGASTGIKTDYFSALDIDCLDPVLAQVIAEYALARLGPAPSRTGRAPKQLLLYRTETPFSKMQLWVERDGASHLVECLGKGNQLVASGIHPGTMKPYEWNELPVLDQLTFVTAESISAFFDDLSATLDMMFGVSVHRAGDGRLSNRAVAASQQALLAPSIDELRRAVATTPNTFETRDEWIRYGVAVRAACGDDTEEGYAIFADFSDRWDGGHNSPEIVRGDWRRFKSPFTLGWAFISDLARAHGYVDPTIEFAAVVQAPEDRVAPPASLSDQWLADEVVSARSAEIRYSPEADRWFVWSGSMWESDAVMQAENLINEELVKIAARIGCMGATSGEKKHYAKEARQICSNGKAGAVRAILQTRRAIAISLGAFDANPWELNTPAGLVDLTTGVLRPADPDAMTSKSTAVAPNDAEPTRWLAFLDEACGGDAELVAYMGRWAGYCLTGSTREQALGFLLGRGGSGKSTYLNTLVNVLKDYAKVSALDTFTASKSDRHSTDIASLEGARLVASSENQTGKRWDEQRVKSLTGGERVTARLMRSDNHTYKPTYKLFFAANVAPSIRAADDAMKRRLQFIPFSIKPKVVDKELDVKLDAESGAILGWMIRGCLEWQRIGLAPPASVLATTDKYFQNEDSIGTFLGKRTTEGGTTRHNDLFLAWRQWGNSQNEYTGTGKQFAQAMLDHGIEVGYDTYGVTLIQQDAFDAV